MPDLPLPELTPGNPENLLSHDARQRIGRAWVEHDLIRKRALSALDTRYRAEPAGCADFMEYLGKGQAGIDFIESRIKAAGVVLRAEAEEYGNLGLPGREFREIMEGSIDEMAYSLEFSTLQRCAQSSGRRIKSRTKDLALSEGARSRFPRKTESKPSWRRNTSTFPRSRK